MRLVSIHEDLTEINKLLLRDDVKENIEAMLDFYERIGYQTPWIGFLAEEEGTYVGSCGFKGAPVDGQVEIAYMTFSKFQKKGYATEMCRQLCKLCELNAPQIKVMARTLPENDFSHRVLIRNGFTNAGTVLDEDDLLVYQWELAPNR